MTKKSSAPKPTSSVPAVVEEKPAPVGRPSSFQEEYIVQTQKLCALGATDEEIADFFDISRRTLSRWKTTYPEFVEALRRGKDAADDRVEDSLYHRALPREIEEEQAIKLKKVIYNKQGKRASEEERVEIVKVRKFVPPDTTAMIFWLKNRRPDQWRDVHKHEHGAAGAFSAMKEEELDKFILDNMKDITPFLDMSVLKAEEETNEG